MTAQALQQAPRRQLFSLALSALVTAGVLAGLLGLAGADGAQQAAKQAAQLARQAPLANQAATTLAAPAATPGA